jgi:hypothetical protein
MVSGQFVQYSNDCLRFVADGNDQILKLPLLSNERSLVGKNYRTLATLLFPLINGSTVYYWSRTVKPTPFIWIVHPWFSLLLQTWNSQHFFTEVLKGCQCQSFPPQTNICEQNQTLSAIWVEPQYRTSF